MLTLIDLAKVGGKGKRASKSTNFVFENEV